MRVSGFTICRNSVKLGYPLEESLRSLLPLVDELVVAVGDSEDSTWDVVTGIGDPRILPFRTVWDTATTEGGAVLADQTNLALARCSGDWAVYLQSDEVLHEVEIEKIRSRLLEHLDQATEALSFSYRHFYGSYSFVQDNWCTWYRREVRAVKTGKGIVSVGDAAGFRLRDGESLRRLIRADSGAHVHHYGWVRPPLVMVEKQQHAVSLYETEEGSGYVPAGARIDPERPYRQLGHLRRFTGSHPAVMRELIPARDWAFDPQIEKQPSRALRYLGILAACPRDSARVLTSRLLLFWNTHSRRPKLR